MRVEQSDDGLILPLTDDVISQLDLKEGDVLEFAIDTDGGLVIFKPVAGEVIDL